MYTPAWNFIQTTIDQVLAEEFLTTNLLADVELIVGVQRGGLIPAVIISHMLKIPMESINYSSTKGRGDNRTEHTNKIPHFDAHTILLVDDINDTGYTMKEIADVYIGRDVDVVSFVLHHKESSVFTPTLKCWTIPHDGPWVVYPWEK